MEGIAVNALLWLATCSFMAGLFFAVGCYQTHITFKEGYGHGHRDAAPIRDTLGRFLRRRE